MKAGTAVVVVIQRAFAIPARLIVRVIALAIVVLVGTNVMRFPNRKDTRTQSGEDAEDEEPCQEETHDGFSDRRRWKKFK